MPDQTDQRQARREATEKLLTSLLTIAPLAVQTLRHLAVNAESPDVRKDAAKLIVDVTLKANEQLVLATELAELRQMVETAEEKLPK